MDNEKKENERPLGVEIRITDNLIKNYIDQTLQAQTKYPLTGIEGMTMGYIFRHQGDEITAKVLMEKSHSAKATMSQVLAGLEKKGYIVSVPSNKDHRRKVITLTETGVKVEAEFKTIFHGLNLRIHQNVSPEEEAALRKTLAKIQGNIRLEGKDEE